MPKAAKAKAVRLKDVTADNWEAVVDLQLDESQDDLVASNVYSLAEASFTPRARPRAIYFGKRLVGFMMYERLEDEGRPYETSIYRFMIDKRHQGKGYGRAALEAAFDEIGKIPGIRTVSIRYMANNPIAKRFYESVGFVEVDRDDGGEIVAERKV
jgi:diamine N-acetyltransferase